MKKILAAAVAALSFAMPVEARIDPNTDKLLATLRADGIEVAFNSPRCARGGFHGSYRFRPLGSYRLMTLCTGADVDARDHSTIRHESIHAIQQCANKRRGTSYTTPLLNVPDEFQQEVVARLYAHEIDFIQTHYNQSDWEVEYEAFLYERTMTASGIIKLFEEVCGPADFPVFTANTGNIFR